MVEYLVALGYTGGCRPQGDPADMQRPMLHTQSASVICHSSGIPIVRHINLKMLFFQQAMR